jgi:hypothetical protein
VSALNPFRARGSLVDALSSALDRGSHGLENVPGLLRRILADESWREFETTRGEHVEHERFADFVAAPPLKGLGASMEMIMRIVGTGDPELLRLLREASKGKRGPRSESKFPVESTGNYGAEESAYTADRLSREAPEEYAAVLRGERTLNAAAVRAGIRRHRVSIRLDSAESAAETLRKHMTPDQIGELRKLLDD